MDFNFSEHKEVLLNGVAHQEVYFNGELVWNSNKDNILKGIVRTTTDNEVVSYTGVDGIFYEIDWGDGSVTTDTKTHTYITIGDYNITVNAGDKDLNFEDFSNLYKVTNLITTQSSFEMLFYRCINLQIIEGVEAENINNIDNMCRGCSSLTTIPNINYSKVITARLSFGECSSLLYKPTFNFSTALTDITDIFTYCSDLTEGAEFGDTSNVAFIGAMHYRNFDILSVSGFSTNSLTGTDGSGIYSRCYALTRIPAMNCNSFSFSANSFEGCAELVDIFDYDGVSGFSGLTNSLDLHWSTKLTKQSLLSVINNLGIAVEGATLTLSQESSDILAYSDVESAIEKGWTITPLPIPESKYVDIELIGMNGAYIDLGIKATQNTKVEIDFELTSDTTTQFLFGSRVGFKDKAFYAAYSVTGTEGITYNVDNISYPMNNKGAITNQRYKLVMSLNENTFNGEVQPTSFTWSGDNNLNLYLGMINNNGENSGSSTSYKGRVYGLKVYEEDSLVINLQTKRFKDTTTAVFVDSITGNEFVSPIGNLYPGSDVTAEISNS